MKRIVLLAALAFMALGAVVEPAMAAAEGSWFFPDAEGTRAFGIAIGMALMVMGAAKGIGNIGANAVQAIARQPEAGDRIFTSMLLSAALIEGFTFFALLIPFTL